MHLLCFNLDHQRFALEFREVKKVIRAVAITPLPQAPELVLGVVNLRGHIVPVVNLRRRLGLPSRPLQLEDSLVWAVAEELEVLLPVDWVDVAEVTDTSASPAEPTMQTQPPLVKGLVRMPDGLVLIHDLAGLLNLHEREALSHALAQL